MSKGFEKKKEADITIFQIKNEWFSIRLNSELKEFSKELNDFELKHKKSIIFIINNNELQYEDLENFFGNTSSNSFHVKLIKPNENEQKIIEHHFLKGSKKPALILKFMLGNYEIPALHPIRNLIEPAIEIEEYLLIYNLFYDLVCQFRRILCRKLVLLEIDVMRDIYFYEQNERPFYKFVFLPTFINKKYKESDQIKNLKKFSEDIQNILIEKFLKIMIHKTIYDENTIKIKSFIEGWEKIPKAGLLKRLEELEFFFFRLILDDSLKSELKNPYNLSFCSNMRENNFNSFIIALWDWQIEKEVPVLKADSFAFDKRDIHEFNPVKTIPDGMFIQINCKKIEYRFPSEIKNKIKWNLAKNRLEIEQFPRKCQTHIRLRLLDITIYPDFYDTFIEELEAFSTIWNDVSVVLDENKCICLCMTISPLASVLTSPVPERITILKEMYVEGIEKICYYGFYISEFYTLNYFSGRPYDLRVHSIEEIANRIKHMSERFLKFCFYPAVRSNWDEKFIQEDLNFFLGLNSDQKYQF